MPAHLQLTEEVAESATLYSLGLLSDIERSSIDRHLQEGCLICQAEISRCGDLLVAWAKESPVSPSSTLRQKLLQSLQKPAESLATSSSPVLFDRAGLTLIRTPRMDWNPGPTPGLWIKVLVENADNDMSTMLIRMGAGSFYPSHRHKGIEEVYVLEGGLRVEGIELTAGDFCVSRPETVHQSTYSESGCLLIVKSSKHDEVLA